MLATEEFANWPLPKRYLAAHYYLAEDKLVSISEPRLAQLGALHLYVWEKELNSIGFTKCSLSENRRRVEEWKNRGNLNKDNAMKLFIDLVGKLYPSWPQYEPLYNEFHREWEAAKEGGHRTGFVREPALGTTSVRKE